MQNMITRLTERLDAIEEKLDQIQIPSNGSEKSSFLEARLLSLENKYMAMNARMGKRE